MLLHAPRAFATAYDSVGVQLGQGRRRRRDRSRAPPRAGSSCCCCCCPAPGIALTTGRVGSRARRRGLGAGRRAIRCAGGALATVARGAGIGLAAFTWWPNGDYRPIQPGERGTVTAAVRSIADVPSGRPSLTAARADQLGGAPSERAVLRGTAERNPVAAAARSPIAVQSAIRRRRRRRHRRRGRPQPRHRRRARPLRQRPPRRARRARRRPSPRPRPRPRRRRRRRLPRPRRRRDRVGRAHPGQDSPMRILVTGARGKVGAATVAALLDAGHDVTALDLGAPVYEAPEPAARRLLPGRPHRRRRRVRRRPRPRRGHPRRGDPGADPQPAATRSSATT